MGLFDSLSTKEEGKKEDIAVTPETAFILSCLSMSGIDGKLHEDEIAILEKISRGNTKGVIENAIKICQGLNVADIADIVAKILNPHQQEVVLANIIELAMADGVLDKKEKDLLEYYVSVFQVEQSIVENIINVISIKNNKSIF